MANPLLDLTQGITTGPVTSAQGAFGPTDTQASKGPRLPAPPKPFPLRALTLRIAQPKVPKGFGT